MDVQELFNCTRFQKDTLSCYLETIHVADTIAQKTEFTPPWKIRVPQGAPALYMVVHGTCSLQVKGGRKTHLHAGDLAILFQGKVHTLENGTNVKMSARGSLVNESGEPVVLINLRFNWDGDEIAPLLPQLPEVIHVRNEDGCLAPWIMNTLRLVSQQHLQDDSGTQDILNRITHFSVVQGIRAHIAGTDAGRSQMLEAIVHGQIGAALYFLHLQPEEPWTLMSLARKCGMCRSAFAREFKQAIGQSPMVYLTDQRMRRACHLLGQGILRIKEIALRSGYQSLPAFSSAFRKWASVTAVSYRKSRMPHSGKDPNTNASPVRIIEPMVSGVSQTPQTGGVA